MHATGRRICRSVPAWRRPRDRATGHPYTPPSAPSRLCVCVVLEGSACAEADHPGWGAYRLRLRGRRSHVPLPRREKYVRGCVVKRACLGAPGLRCGVLIEASRRRCVSCSRARDRARNATRGDEFRFYSSSAWQSMRRQVKEEEGEACTWCGATDRPLTVDHIRPIRSHPHLALERNNLTVACRSCQNRRQWLPGGGRGAP